MVYEKEGRRIRGMLLDGDNDDEVEQCLNDSEASGGGGDAHATSQIYQNKQF